MCEKGWYWPDSPANTMLSRVGGGLFGRPEGKARGVQENLWPKFILSNAPLRATSSTVFGSIRFAILKLLKYTDLSQSW